ncbi:MAG TPA: hypothetical protein VF868_17285 [Bacteroidia bacterium]|jgi:hypothetical protein
MRSRNPQNHNRNRDNQQAESSGGRTNWDWDRNPDNDDWSRHDNRSHPQHYNDHSYNRNSNSGSYRRNLNDNSIYNDHNEGRYGQSYNNMFNDRDNSYDQYGDGRYRRRYGQYEDNNRDYRSDDSHYYNSRPDSSFRNNRERSYGSYDNDDRNFFERAGDRIRQAWDNFTDNEDDQYDNYGTNIHGSARRGMPERGSNFNAGSYGHRYENDRGSRYHDNHRRDLNEDLGRYNEDRRLRNNSSGRRNNNDW